ncbi:Acetyltransferase (GNAT) family protein [Pseudomonas benzenivorans]|nr:GNAT family N-acetyltransferase [Pseudomonas benzenivorans]SDG69120.1 Acetyltransferase (GNAT) family protein [Pseudomonas benzenivorans]
MHYRALPAPLKPLADKFYRAHRSPMRANRDDRVWVAQQQEIVAALCLRPIAGGHWLTGLFVAPPQRRQGVARRLIEQAVTEADGPVWLFCQPGLGDFYRRQGFMPCGSLPEALAERLARYQRSKALIALYR